MPMFSCGIPTKKMVLELMAGIIRVESVVGEGSKFTVTLLIASSEVYFS